MKKLVIASDNTHKVKEIKEILQGTGFEIFTKTEIGKGDLEVEEDADSLEENAKLKALSLQDGDEPYYVLADDTGLFVEALNGQPGIHTARYAGVDATDQENRTKLLRELETKDNRKAIFRTVIAWANPKGKVSFAIGECRGQIAKCERGDAGFGYDPVFIPEGKKETFAEMTDDEKNSISHRRRALDRLRSTLLSSREEL